MQAELDATQTRRPIYIVGINAIGQESGNPGMMSGRQLPWLQANTDFDVWSNWHVEYRDVIIVGPGNERIDAYNLTSHNLAEPANYAALRDQLVDAANAE
jgi:hypothetical protein